MSRPARRREKNFVRIIPDNDVSPVGVYLRLLDLKNSFSFDIDIETTQTTATQVKATLNIEKLVNQGVYQTENYKLSARRTGPSDQFVGYIFDEYSLSKGAVEDTIGKNLRFDFNNLTIYKLEFVVESYDANGVYNKCERIYNFKYYESPVRLNSNFNFGKNVGEGDRISVTGLSLVGAPTDETVPEALDSNGRVIVANTPFHYINSSQMVVDIDGNQAADQHGGPLIDPAVRFTFQRAENPASAPAQTDDTYEDAGYSYNQDFNAVYEPRVLTYNSDGNYTLPANTLSEGTYKMKVSAFWALGYETTQTPQEYVHVINRPEIVSVVTEPLYVDNRAQKVITIGVTFSGEITDKIWFNFYNSSGDKVARAGGASGLEFQTGTGTKYYNL
jgi:hypothetical protein